LELQNDLFFLSWFSEEVEVWILINGVFEVDVSIASFSTFEDFYALLVVFQLSDEFSGFGVFYYRSYRDY
jgi:hypothetical protein